MVCVGRLAREKQHDVLRPVLVPGGTVKPQVRLTFVGDGPDRRRLRRVFTGTPGPFIAEDTRATRNALGLPACPPGRPRSVGTQWRAALATSAATPAEPWRCSVYLG